jgi:RimJ/RimL family protein N-acetyltransferase
MGIAKLLRRQEPPDPYLSQPIRTERFVLANCNRRDAIKVTAPWRTDPEVLENLMYSQTSYTAVEWVRSVGRPDGNERFIHAIMPKEGGGTIGAHRLSINRSGTASLAIVIHARSWWGKGVFEEVRRGIMDHFAASERVIRFEGHVLARNVSSIYNYQKLGFRVVGYETKSWLSPFSETHMDTVQFEMMADDWIAQSQVAVEADDQ